MFWKRKKQLPPVPQVPLSDEERQGIVAALVKHGTVLQDVDFIGVRYCHGDNVDTDKVFDAAMAVLKLAQKWGRIVPDRIDSY